MPSCYVRLSWEMLKFYLEADVDRVSRIFYALRYRLIWLMGLILLGSRLDRVSIDSAIGVELVFSVSSVG
jgi:hypothetical protein